MEWNRIRQRRKYHPYLVEREKNRNNKSFPLTFVNNLQSQSIKVPPLSGQGPEPITLLSPQGQRQLPDPSSMDHQTTLQR